MKNPVIWDAILRTADAAGVDAVIICDPQTDFYNPNVIRSSVGCVFTKQIASANSEETLAWLQKQNIKIFCTYLKASSPYHLVDLLSQQPLLWEQKQLAFPIFG
ncbi:MAG: TrmH family RNA methyltransferase [Cytophagales bacterium]|nr:TrmH family RNA methyltransferase [Cytophagales bacterium]